ncbi:hypothetical protein [Leptospira alstonii]|uniref:hypothetical protein n=1 Tax=Leptospira alstonii TaxID=28452 RepID=UPI00055C186A|nr:hypothetical protein [Leptospira alstonii]
MSETYKDEANRLSSKLSEEIYHTRQATLPWQSGISNYFKRELTIVLFDNEYLPWALWKCSGLEAVPLSFGIPNNSIEQFNSEINKENVWFFVAFVYEQPIATQLTRLPFVILKASLLPMAKWVATLDLQK